MCSRRIRFGFSVFLIILLLSTVALYAGKYNQVVGIGAPLPQFNNQPATDGTTLTLRPVTFTPWQQRLATYRGGIVVVDFWATWCAPCVERFPHIYYRTGKLRDRLTGDNPNKQFTDKDVEAAIQKLLAASK